MLTDLSIKNFRLFEKFKIDNLARVNLIVGKNNVGKSTLLEAIQLLVSQGSPQALFEQLEARGEISLDEESFHRKRARRYNISHLFFGHFLQNGSCLRLTASGVSDLLFEITFVRGFEQLSLFEFEDDDRKSTSPSYLKLNYGGSKEVEITINVFPALLSASSRELIDRRLARINRAQTTLLPQSNYITTKGIGYDSLARSL